jgi:hypothetical protein
MLVASQHFSQNLGHHLAGATTHDSYRQPCTGMFVFNVYHIRIDGIYINAYAYDSSNDFFAFYFLLFCDRCHTFLDVAYYDTVIIVGRYLFAHVL